MAEISDYIYSGSMLIINELVSQLPFGFRILGKLIINMIMLKDVKPNPEDDTLGYLKDMQKALKVMNTKLDHMIGLIKKIELANLLHMQRLN